MTDFIHRWNIDDPACLAMLEFKQTFQDLFADISIHAQAGKIGWFQQS